MKYNYELSLAGIQLPVSFRFSKTADLFGGFVVQSEKDGLSLLPEDWEFGKNVGFNEDAFAEYSLFTGTASEALLPYGRFIVHAVAFACHGRAWLITAPSGVGKSTQIKTLQELYHGEFGVICGDRPILHLLEDNSVMVYPSPWNGKENWYGAEAALLEGIIYLQRGQNNELRQLPAEKAALPMYFSMIHNGSSTEIIQQVAGCEAELLRRIPVWMMTNKGVPESTEMMHEVLFS